MGELSCSDMTAPAGQLELFKVRRQGTDFLDWKRGERVLALEHEDRMAGPRAPACRCERPWPMGDEDRCIRCGRTVE